MIGNEVDRLRIQIRAGSERKSRVVPSKVVQRGNVGRQGLRFSTGGGTERKARKEEKILRFLNREIAAVIRKRSVKVECECGKGRGVNWGGAILATNLDHVCGKSDVCSSISETFELVCQRKLFHFKDHVFRSRKKNPLG